MYNVIAITNRNLAGDAYWSQLEKIASSKVHAIILREKDLSEQDYIVWAKMALQICNAHQKTCILHNFGKAAITLHVPHFHCSLAYLKEHTAIRFYMNTLGVSVHSVDEALEAAELGATYIMASHVFETACKPDSKPIGPDTVQAICQAVEIPVYALGGVTPQTVPELKGTGITGLASMSGLMTSEDPAAYLKELNG